MSSASQDYASHRRYVIGYHVVAFLLLFINLVYALYALFTSFSAQTLVATGTAVGLLLLFYYARDFALRDQDRIIRLEEKLRLARLLPDDMESKIDELTTQQLIALRFASDGELPELTQRVLAENITKGADIKKLIKHWRPDNQRI